MAVKRTIYQRKVDVDMLNAVKSLLADISRVSPSSEQKNIYMVTVVLLTVTTCQVTQLNIDIFHFTSSNFGFQVDLPPS